MRINALFSSADIRTTIFLIYSKKKINQKKKMEISPSFMLDDKIPVMISELIKVRHDN